MASQPSPFDPLDRLEPGEDRFAIRENDPVGPQAITAWAHLRRNWLFKAFGTEPVGEAKRKLAAELAQCAEAEEKAMQWSERQQGHEAPAEVRATYAGVQLSEEQVAQAKRQKLAEDFQRHLAEADYCAAELLVLDGPAASAELTLQSATIHELALNAKMISRREGV